MDSKERVTAADEARQAGKEGMMETLREALLEARQVLVVACGEEAPYIKIALRHIDAALAAPATASAGVSAVKCPVCNGRGIVPAGFYNSTEASWASTSANPDQCRSCAGRGWLAAPPTGAIGEREPYGGLECFVTDAREQVRVNGEADWVDLKNLLRIIDERESAIQASAPATGAIGELVAKWRNEHKQMDDNYTLEELCGRAKCADELEAAIQSSAPASAEGERK